MTLEEIGPATSPPLGGRLTQATNPRGEIVTVWITAFAFAEYDMGVIWSAAEAMYLAGFFALIGGTKVIHVATDDCINWLKNTAQI